MIIYVFLALVAVAGGALIQEGRWELRTQRPDGWSNIVAGTCIVAIAAVLTATLTLAE